MRPDNVIVISGLGFNWAVTVVPCPVMQRFPRVPGGVWGGDELRRPSDLCRWLQKLCQTKKSGLAELPAHHSVRNQPSA